jgi:lipopolysaccharide biosynthesis glycosyltransferase
MPPYNILIGCDQAYYDDWGITLLRSTNHYNPWISLHCYIVNPKNTVELDFVNYTYEEKTFVNNDSKIGYLQSVRFLAADKYFDKTQYVLSLDADTICTKSFTEEEFLELFKHNTVLQHPKDGRWLAGLVAFGQSKFRKEYANLLMTDTVETWTSGRDQDILATIADKYRFYPASKKWMSIGKNGSGSIFLTLKGDQKYTDKYLNIYQQYKEYTKN